MQSGATPRPEMAAPMQRLAAAMAAKGRRGGDIAMALVHEPARGANPSRALAPGVEARPWRELVADLE